MKSGKSRSTRRLRKISTTERRGRRKRARPTIYKGKKIVIKKPAEKPELYIEGKRVVIELVGNAYWTNLAPYATYEGSLMGLAKALIDSGVI